jgi:hypothetical protein
MRRVWRQFVIVDVDLIVTFGFFEKFENSSVEADLSGASRDEVVHSRPCSSSVPEM